MRCCLWPGSLIFLFTLWVAWHNVPSDRSSSPWVSAITSIVPLRPVGIPGFRGGSDTLDSLGSSAVWFYHGVRCHCNVLCDCQRGLSCCYQLLPAGSLILLVGLSFNWHSVPSGLSSSPWVSATATIVHLHPVRFTGFSSGSFGFSTSLSLRVFAMWPPFRVESVSVLDRNVGSSFTFLVFGWSLRAEVSLTGRVCLSSLSVRRLFAHLP